MKKMLAMLLALVLCVGVLTGCGGKARTDYPTTLKATLEEMASIQKGDFKYTVYDTADNYECTISISKNEDNYVVSEVKVKTENESYTLKDVLKLVDNVLYLNLAELVKPMQQSEEWKDSEYAEYVDKMELKWFAIPLPDEYGKRLPEMANAWNAIVKDLFKTIGETGKEEGKVQDFHIVYPNAGAVGEAINMLAKNIEDNTPELPKIAQMAIDFNGTIYLKKIIDFYYEEFKAVLINQGYTEEDVEEMRDAYYGDDVLDQWLDYIAEMMSDVDYYALADSLASFGGFYGNVKDNYVTGEVIAKVSGYRYTLEGELKYDSGSDVGFKLEYYSRTPVITAPTDSNMTDLVKVADVLSELFQKVEDEGFDWGDIWGGSDFDWNDTDDAYTTDGYEYTTDGYITDDSSWD